MTVRQQWLVTPCGWLCALLILALLPGCKTAATPLWELVDPGGGGATQAVYHVPDSAHLFVGSNVGGFRYSADGGERFRVVNEGLEFGSSAADNIQEISGYRVGDTIHVVGSATAGILYWRSITADGLGPTWERILDVRQAQKRGATNLGALAVDASVSHLYAGIGNPNNLTFNRLIELDPDVSGQVFIFRIGDDATGPAPPQAAGTLSLPSVCSGLEGGPYFHVTDLAAVSIDGAEYLYAGTSEGLLLIGNPRSADPDCRRLLVPGHNPYVLAVRPDAQDPADVVLLLNEGRMQRHKANSRNRGRTEPGGLFHTTAALAPSPDWQDITPRQARGEGLGELERGRARPGELVLSGDARSEMGVLFTPDFSRGRWETVLDRSFISRKGKTRNLDGWRRTEGAFRGVKETAIHDAADGIAAIYVGGLQGRMVTGQRRGDGFRFAQMYTVVSGGTSQPRYGNRGLPLMVPWRAFADPQDGDRVLFLYHDNIMFVSDDAGSSFRRPVLKFGWGTDVLFDPGGERIFLAYTVGNHLEAGGRNRAEQGGLLVGDRQGFSWKDFGPQLPAAGPVEALALAGGELCANVYRQGVFCSALDGRLSWRRAVPPTLEVLYLVDVRDDPVLWVITADGQLCRIAAGEPACSELPVTMRQFERLWFDAGRLWLVAKRGTSYVSELRPSPDWQPVDAAITDLRTLSFGEERVALIASGSDGLFATRTPLERDSWCQVSFDGLDGNRVISAIADPAGGDYLYVAVDGVGFYRASLDNLARHVVNDCAGET